MEKHNVLKFCVIPGSRFCVHLYDTSWHNFQTRGQEASKLI